MTGWYVTANDIKHWTETNKRRAEEILPLLIKRLILASCKPDSINFPSGDSVAVGGWDGMLEVNDEIDKTFMEFIPKGKSGWEFGTNHNVKGKADEDYEKRFNKPDPFILDQTTYVFVTSRLWTKRDQWVSTKKSDNKWKDVRGINAETLETWLEKCPAVHRWFAEEVGKRSKDLWDVEQEWNKLSSSTGVKITKDFFLHDRNEERKELRSKLNRGKTLCRIKSKSKLESYGFLLSVIIEDEKLKARSLVIQNQQAWDLISQSNHKLILIPKGFIPDGVGFAISNGHNVVIPIDDMDANEASIILPNHQRIIRQEAIQKLGFNEEKATQIYQDTKGYIEPLIRHNLMRPIDYREPPNWKKEIPSNILFAIFFVSEWNEENEKDKQAIEQLSNVSYNEFSNVINRLSKETDPPIRRIGNTWQLVSKMDLWLMIAPLINIDVLNRLDSVIQVVIPDLDPSFDLPSDKKFMAKVLGVIPQYSREIKCGLADTLAILSVYGDEFSNQLGGVKPSSLVNCWVKRVFEGNESTCFWYSIREVTALIAEAAPDTFLKAIEIASKDDSIFFSLFKSAGDGVFGGCYHSGLLWGLEVTSWNKQYLARVCQCLARLSEIDSDGKWGNSPFNSLVEIFLGQINNTSVTYKEKLIILERVIVPQYPTIAWRLMNALLPGKTDSSVGINKPRYQELIGEIEKHSTYKEYLMYVEEIVNIMLQEIETSKYERISDLINSFNFYTVDQQNTVIKKLLEIDKEDIPYENRKQILGILRQTIAEHRKYPKADWAWPLELVNRLEEVYNYLQFEDVLERNIFLFNDYSPEIIYRLNKIEFDYDEYQNVLLEKRIRAICQIYEQLKIEGILTLVTNCSMPKLVGSIAYNSSINQEMQSIALMWLEDEGKKKDFSYGYLNTLSSKSVKDGLKLLKEHKEWGSQKKANMLLCMQLNSETLKLIDELTDEGKQVFWKNVDAFINIMENDLVSYVSKQLLNYNRPKAALYILNQLIDSKENNKYLNPQLLAEILIKIVIGPKNHEEITTTTIEYEITRAIKFLQESIEVPEVELQRIEWFYLNLSRRNGFVPIYLKKCIAAEPAFFAQMIIWMYKRNDGNQDSREELSDEVVAERAKKCKKIIKCLTTLPGQDENGIDFEYLKSWINEAREILSSHGRQSVGDLEIGGYLSRSPMGQDRIWPHEAVRRIIESVKSDKIDQGIKIGVLNSRGVTMRNPYTGGKQERFLAKKYANYADSEIIQFSSPRTAEILQSISNSYDSDADREDMEVELEK
ncbi:hypothetical protein [Bacillus cereus]|uniref:hypothetical protein n=1 Tax=Bacillus cereus TaxID=1396 RepID=UPI002A016097|nr:hypothetical protein [Bacillus cereus]